jgi:site-specific DNA recombinase
MTSVSGGRATLTVMMTAKGAVLYARVSTKEQAQQNNSLPVQEGKFRDFCTRTGLEVIKMFIDKQSARTDERPQFQAMLMFCRQNRKRIACVVVADLSRLARNVADQAHTISTLAQLGIKLESIDEPNLDGTATGKLSANVLGAVNQFFSDSLSERTKYRMEALVKTGRFLWPAPLGYLNVDKKLVGDPERAPLVRKAFELMSSGSCPTGDAVLKMVTGMGLRTKKGRAVKKQTFARMLSNELYAGGIVSKDVRVKGVHDPIVPEHLFQTVQDKLNGKSSPHKRQSEEFPLRGIVRCAKCGKNLTVGWAKGRKERYAHYWCWTKGCRAVGLRREELEGQFVDLLSRMQPTAELIAKLPELAAREWEERKIRIGSRCGDTTQATS